MNRIAGTQGLLAFAEHGPEWRSLRRTAAELMKPNAMNRTVLIHEAESTQLLLDCLSEPDILFYHLQRFTISTTFSTVGGVRLPQIDSPLSNKWFQFLGMLAKLFEPGGIPPVDLLPILKFIPDQFAKNWRARCDTCRDLLDEIVGELIDVISQQRSKSTPLEIPTLFGSEIAGSKEQVLLSTDFVLKWARSQSELC
ncbi:hypothetical protein FRC03_012902 [Tulasnella sp. 419]|nr:hypothetical protein FRC03_012902 [Tulasnella sp. 419]